MNKKLVIALSNLIFVTLGCQQSTGFKSSASESSISKSCVSQKAVDVTSLEIAGDKGATPGQTVRYKLNEDLGCSSSQTVSWKTASGKALGDGGMVAASYNKPGEYVVTAQVQEQGAPSPYTLSYKTVVTSGLAINAPQVGIAEIDSHFELVVPAGVAITAAQWNFGDGQPVINDFGPIDYAYFGAGNYNVTVTVTLANGDTSTASRPIQILPANDTMNCVNQLAISGPTSGSVGAPASFSLFIPNCVAAVVNRLKWDFGDGSPVASTQSVMHTFTQAGSYHVTVGLYQGEAANPFATLSLDIVIAPTGTPDPGGDPTNPTNPDPNECSMVGQTRSTQGEIYTESASCGVNGTRTDSYRDTVTQTCQLVGDIRRWVDTGRVKNMTNQGACMGQACEVPASALNGQSPASLGLQVIGGKFYLPDGVSKTFYSSTSPAGACSAVSMTRSCSNGALGGGDSYVNLVCHDGCPGFGSHGSTKSGVVTGSEQVVKTCAYGETGIFDIYNSISEQVCQDGQVKNTSTTRGTIKTAGVCPTYSYVPTEQYTACSAACGGEQQQISKCVDSNGAAAPAERCMGAAPVVKRVCDGNPDSVKRSEAQVVSEDGGSSVKCPANQIGTITRTRDVTITTNYACVNHSVQQVSQVRTEGAWVEEKYCRDYVPYRCSADSLSNTEAMGRYQWMLKCQDQVPVVKSFLENFEQYAMGKGTAAGLVMNGREVYATFMYMEGGKEKTWKAPTDKKASCTVREGLYVAAVCTASCATPEQQILGQKGPQGKLAYDSFLNSWQEKFKSVATMQKNAGMNAKLVKKTEVDNWVTEVVDTEHVILNFTTKSGGVLRLTPNHPILTAAGSMKVAGSFKVGESLVRLGGELDPIVSIESTQYYGKVYNLFVKSSELEHNVVVTNGYLNGTAFFQNEGAKHLNQRILRSNLVRGALD